MKAPPLSFPSRNLPEPQQKSLPSSLPFQRTLQDESRLLPLLRTGRVSVVYKCQIMQSMTSVFCLGSKYLDIFSLMVFFRHAGMEVRRGDAFEHHRKLRAASR
jgi:hypothetical protein